MQQNYFFQLVQKFATKRIDQFREKTRCAANFRISRIQLFALKRSDQTNFRSIRYKSMVSYSFWTRRSSASVSNVLFWKSTGNYVDAVKYEPRSLILLITLSKIHFVEKKRRFSTIFHFCIIKVTHRYKILLITVCCSSYWTYNSYQATWKIKKKKSWKLRQLYSNL